MATQQINATNITPPRVPLVDERTGLISREWYRFFLSLFTLTGGGSNYTSLTDLQVGPPPVQLDEVISHIPSEVGGAPSQTAVVEQIAELQKQVSGIESTPDDGLLDQIAELQKQINGLMMKAYQPTAAPATYTANFSVAASDVWVINNKPGSSCTVTLPSASTNTGRVLRFQNYQAQTLVSASSNVVPLTGGAAGTAILAAVAGDTCTLVSDGTNWIMTQYVPNNVLLLE